MDMDMDMDMAEEGRHIGAEPAIVHGLGFRVRAHTLMPSAR